MLINTMKCIFPKLTSMQQRFICAGTGVLFSSSAVGSLYYSKKFIDYHRALQISGDYVSDNIEKGGNIVIKGIDNIVNKFPKKTLISDKMSDKLSCCIFEPIYTHALLPVIFVSSSVCTFSPIGVGIYIYDDLKKFKIMMTNTDQCCIIIRRAGMKTLLYPVLLGTSFGISCASMFIVNIFVADIMEN